VIRLNRRQAIAAAALVAAGCGSAGRGRTPSRAGSTLDATWADSAGDGVLRRAPGEPLASRTELGAPAAAAAVVATLAHVTDAHVLDASSPARVSFLDRLGAPFQSTFRPQETLTAQVLAGALDAVRALRPDAVIQGGDLIDNDQHNELELALTVLRGGRARPGSGPHGYCGVQLASNPDPFYYRPDVDAPRHPGLLAAAARPFTSAGAGAPTLHVLGDHDILVAGEIAPTSLTRALAVGERALWELPPGLTVPRGEQASSPDGPPRAELVDRFLAQALAGPTVRVPSDGGRRELDAGEVLARIRPPGGSLLDYHVDVAPRLRVIVLDLANRAGGSGGVVHPGQAAWLAGELAAAGDRWVIVASHQPLASSAGGDALLALLDRAPRVIAAVAGHTHRNRIVPRPTAAGGYWLITTASLVDHPQQARAIRVVETAGGGVALETWMLDHARPRSLGAVARQLAYLDAQGGRPHGFAGGRLDRNVRLYRR
jgi:3',5'-cyclic AMP phosphodiesterase CpdA